MYLLLLGIIFLVLKYLQIDPVATWSWWWVLSPFGLATLWWAWADWSGWTKRKAMERDDKRRLDRIEKQRESLGLGPRRR